MVAYEGVYQENITVFRAFPARTKILPQTYLSPLFYTIARPFRNHLPNSIKKVSKSFIRHKEHGKTNHKFFE